jgi:hypothetical protein
VVSSNPKLEQPVVDFDDLYPGRFLKCGLLHGQQVTYTITHVTRDELEGEKGKKIHGILRFKEIAEELTLNRTNGICLREMFGRNVADWIGKRVTLRPDRAKLGPKMVDCIRVHGSPDIDGDLEAEITLPRKKPFTMRLVCTRRSVPTAAEYERCKDMAAFEQLEARRSEHWKYLTNAGRKPIKEASDACKQRLTAPAPESAKTEPAAAAPADDSAPQSATAEPFDPERALEQLTKPVDAEALRAAWVAVCDHFDALGQDVPLTHEAAYQLSKESFDEHA